LWQLLEENQGIEVYHDTTKLIDKANLISRTTKLQPAIFSSQIRHEQAK
jgi:hypothetical protein